MDNLGELYEFRGLPVRSKVKNGTKLVAVADVCTAMGLIPYVNGSFSKYYRLLPERDLDNICDQAGGPHSTGAARVKACKVSGVRRLARVAGSVLANEFLQWALEVVFGVTEPAATQTNGQTNGQTATVVEAPKKFTAFDYPPTNGQIFVLEHKQEPWFTATSVCNTLGFARDPGRGYQWLISRLPEDSRDGINRMDAKSHKIFLGYILSTPIISEKGFRTLMALSDTGSSPAFQNWFDQYLLPKANEVVRRTLAADMGEEPEQALAPEPVEAPCKEPIGACDDYATKKHSFKYKDAPYPRLRALAAHDGVWLVCRDVVALLDIEEHANHVTRATADLSPQDKKRSNKYAGKPLLITVNGAVQMAKAQRNEHFIKWLHEKVLPVLEGTEMPEATSEMPLLKLMEQLPEAPAPVTPMADSPAYPASWLDLWQKHLEAMQTLTDLVNSVCQQQACMPSGLVGRAMQATN